MLCAKLKEARNGHERQRGEEKRQYKVCSEPAIYLQECFVLFATSFIRWASHWLAEHAIPAEMLWMFANWASNTRYRLQPTSPHR